MKEDGKLRSKLQRVEGGGRRKAESGKAERNEVHFRVCRVGCIRWLDD